MTSNISQTKLMLQHTRRKAWLPILSSVVQFLLGPTLMLYLLDIRMFYYNDSPATPERVFGAAMDYINGVYGLMQCMVLLVGAILVAMFGFSHLYSKKMTDLYHSMAITRNREFSIGYLCGLLYWLIPSLISSLMTLLVIYVKIGVASYYGHIFATLAHHQLMNILFFLSIYHVSLLAVSISGNIFNTLINIAALGLLAIGVYSIGYLYAAEYFVTFSYEDAPLYEIAGLSPLATPFLFYAAEYERSELDFPVIALILCFLLMVLAGFFALYLYRNRPSEHAERGTTLTGYAGTIRFIVSVLAGLFGSWFVGEVVDGRSLELSWGIFMTFLLTFITYGLLDMAFSVNMKAFFSHKVMLICTSILSVLLFLSYKYDVVGYDTYLPNKAKIESAEVQASFLVGDDYYYFDENGNYISHYNYRPTPSIRIEDPEVIYLAMQDGIANTEAYTGNITFTVTKKGGRAYKRNYSLSEEGMQLLSKYVDSKDYLEKAYPVASGKTVLPKRIYIDSYLFEDTIGVALTKPEDIEQFMQAYTQDFAEHHTIEDLTESFNLGIGQSISLVFDSKEQWVPSVSIDLPANYERTIAFLKERGPVLDRITPTLYENLLYSEELDSSIKEYLEQQSFDTISDLIRLGYLNWHSKYSAEEYVYIGEASIGDVYSRSYSCYIKKDYLP